ncbi:hypothetical protein [Streptomyces sp. YIM 98790]|uniref:hypothetical protein n=1 Tax=Streptomyces sp. YIM 98790 TaxID=2689077 RepID=UPI00140C7636|nr:hypothetical protein [Streptomyces sp. YIM 98790]
MTFDALARRAARAGGLPISACTLRRALDGRLPTRHTVLAFARAADADERTAERLWKAAADTGRPLRVRTRYVPGRITTPAGLAKAMQRLRTEAGNPTYRVLAAAPEAQGQLSRSALRLALTGQRLPSERLLVGFAAACHLSPEITDALLTARARILHGPPRQPACPCAAAEEAEERRRRDAAARPWLQGPEASADHRRFDNLTDEDIAAWEAELRAAAPGPSPAT